MKCSDIPDELIVYIVDKLSHEDYPPHPMFEWKGGDMRPKGGVHWVMRWDLQEALGLPENLVLAKLRKLIVRGLLDGCFCGCRGDLELAEDGAWMLVTPLTPDVKRKFERFAELCSTVQPHDPEGVEGAVLERGRTRQVRNPG